MNKNKLDSTEYLFFFLITFKFKKEEEEFRMEEFRMAIEPKNKRPTRRLTQKNPPKPPIEWIENFKLRHDVFIDEDDIERRKAKFFELVAPFIAKRGGKINDLWFKIAFPQNQEFTIYYKNKNMETGYPFAVVYNENRFVRDEKIMCTCINTLAHNKNAGYPDGFDKKAFEESKEQVVDFFFDMLDNHVITYTDISKQPIAYALDHLNIHFSLAAYAILHAKDIYININLTTYGASVATAQNFSNKDELWIKSNMEYSFYI